MPGTKKPVTDDCHPHFMIEMGESFLNDLSQQKSIHKFRKGDFLFNEGIPSSGLFCVMEGNVKLTKATLDGKDNLVNITIPGEMIGELNGPQSFSAVAMTDGTFCFLERTKFMSLVERYPRFSMLLAQHYRQEHLSMQHLYVGLLHRNVRQRVELLIAHLATRHGNKSSLGTRIDLPLTREDMSSMIGVATETLIRVLSDLKQEKLIAQAGKSMIILQPNFFKLG